jgi:hypothetical protein
LAKGNKGIQRNLNVSCSASIEAPFFGPQLIPTSIIGSFFVLVSEAFLGQLQDDVWAHFRMKKAQKHLHHFDAPFLKAIWGPHGSMLGSPGTLLGGEITRN